MTASVTNLRTARKRRARAERRATADTNARLHGESKADRAARLAETQKTQRQVDAHRRETPPPDDG